MNKLLLFEIYALTEVSKNSSRKLLCMSPETSGRMKRPKTRTEKLLIDYRWRGVHAFNRKWNCLSLERKKKKKQICMNSNAVQKTQ